MNDEELIKKIYTDYWKYMIAKDTTGLKSIMSEDYYLLHMTGVKQTAEVFLKGPLDGTFNYYSAEHDEIIVHIIAEGCEATMVG